MCLTGERDTLTGAGWVPVCRSRLPFLFRGGSRDRSSSSSSSSSSSRIEEVAPAVADARLAAALADEEAGSIVEGRVGLDDGGVEHDAVAVALSNGVGGGQHRERSVGVHSDRVKGRRGGRRGSGGGEKEGEAEGEEEGGVRGCNHRRVYEREASELRG